MQPSTPSSTTVTLYYNKAPLEVYSAIAERMGLASGQIITHETEFMQLIRQNAEYCEELIDATRKKD